MQIREDVRKMLAETDWGIEPVEENPGESASGPAVAVPVEAVTDGRVAELSVENRPFVKIRIVYLI